MRNGIRMGDLRDMVYFKSKLIDLSNQLIKSNPGLKIDIDKELKYYASIRNEILPLLTDTVVMSNEAICNGDKILIEGK